MEMLQIAIMLKQRSMHMVDLYDLITSCAQPWLYTTIPGPLHLFHLPQ